MKKKIYILMVFFFLFFFLSFFIPYTRSYDTNYAHPSLTEEIAKFYNFNNEDKLTQGEIGWMKWGSLHEDTPPRYINHFYDPLYNRGWEGKTPANFLASTAKDWAINSEKQSLPGYSGDYSWPRAIYDYLSNNRERSYQSLGHLLHLLEDMGVPAHTRDDTHLPFPTMESAYEAWAEQYSQKNKLNLAENLYNQKKSPLVFNRLDQFIDEMAKYSNQYFFSADTIKDTLEKGKYPQPKIIEEKIEELSSGQKVKYGYGIDDQGKKFPLVRVEPAWRNFRPEKYLIDERVAFEYWQRLTPRLVLLGTGVVKLFKNEARRIEKAGIKSLPSSSLWKKIKTLVKKPEKNIISQINAFLSYNSEESSKDVLSTTLFKRAEAKENNLAPEKYDAQWLTQSDYRSLKPGKTAVLWVDYKNTGNTDWYKDYVTLVTDLEKNESAEMFFHSSWMTKRKVTNLSRKRVKPGETGRFSFKIQAPSEPGVYKIYFRPVYLDGQGSHWLGKDYGLYWQITIKGETKKEEKKISAPITKEDKIISPLQVNEEKSLPIVSPIKTAPENILPLPDIFYRRGGGDSAIKPPVQIAENVSLNNQNSSNDQTKDNSSNNSSAEKGSSDNATNNTSQNKIKKTILISEIQISGKTSKDEFIELYNPMDSAVDLTGWSLKRRSQTGSTEYIIAASSSFKGIIPAHGFYLITHPEDYTGQITSDLTYSSSSYGLSSDNTIILYDAEEQIIDQVGFGKAQQAENTVFSANPGDYQSIERKAKEDSTSSSMLAIDKYLGNSYDSNNNSYDFILRTLSEPQNSQSLLEPREASPEKLDNNSSKKTAQTLEAAQNLTAQHIYNTSDSIKLLWTDPSSTEEKRYKILYHEIEKKEECQTSLNWQEREIMANMENSYQITTFDHLKEDTLYCLALKIYQGQSSSGLSNLIQAKTLKVSSSNTAACHPLLADNWHLTGLYEQTLIPENNPYCVLNSAQILPQGKTLTIKPGVVIKFGQAYQEGWYMWPTKLTLSGNLKIEGTEINPVIFTSLKDDTYAGDTNGDGKKSKPNALDWGMLSLEGEDSQYSIDHAFFRYGGEGTAMIKKTGKSPLIIQNSVIEESLIGLYINNSNVENAVILNNNIIQNNTNWGMYLGPNTKAKITHNDFFNNGISNNEGAGGISLQSSKNSSLEMEDNNIWGNKGYGVKNTAAEPAQLVIKNNWWGDKSGPYHPENNPQGLGDRISDKITFEPWLLEKIKLAE